MELAYLNTTSGGEHSDIHYRSHVDLVSDSEKQTMFDGTGESTLVL
jgi:hypothetical protein